MQWMTKPAMSASSPRQDCGQFAGSWQNRSSALASSVGIIAGLLTFPDVLLVQGGVRAFVDITRP